MSWHTRLCTTKFDIFTDLTILCFTVAAYLPQVQQLQRSRSPKGLAAGHVLCSVIFSSSQLAWSIYSAGYSWPETNRSLVDILTRGSLTPLETVGVSLGHIQVVVQWCCVVAVLVSYVSCAHRSGGDAAFVSVASVAFAAVSIVPAMAWVFPAPKDNEDASTMILLGLTTSIPALMAPVSAMLHPLTQILTMRQERAEPGALNLESLSLQAFSSFMLALCWALRLGVELPRWTSENETPLLAFYKNSFLASNYAVNAIGCAVVALMYWMLSRPGCEQGNSLAEKLPLLEAGYRDEKTMPAEQVVLSEKAALFDEELLLD